MPVRLHELPERLSPPSPPGKFRWSLIVLLCLVIGAGLTLLFSTNQDALDTGSMWFWLRFLILPLVVGFFLYGLRRLAFENQHAYVDSWNKCRAKLEEESTTDGQRAIALLATSYQTAGGSECLAELLRAGNKPLQTVFLPFNSKTMRWSPLVDQYSSRPEDYEQRLKLWFERALVAPAVDLPRLFPGQAVRVRIRHNQVLSDRAVLEIWQSCAQSRMLIIESVTVATGDDGLMWLDTWLDQRKAFPLLLSVEVNLFEMPVADQAESVSAVLLARSEYCQEHSIKPAAWIHRPLLMSCDSHSARDVLLWGRVGADSQLFAWQGQLASNRSWELHQVLRDQGCQLESSACLRLDDTLGAPGSAVGNISMIVGSEQAAADQQPQLLMAHDLTPHWCVVQPA